MLPNSRWIRGALFTLVVGVVGLLIQQPWRTAPAVPPRLPPLPQECREHLVRMKLALEQGTSLRDFQALRLDLFTYIDSHDLNPRARFATLRNLTERAERHWRWFVDHRYAFDLGTPVPLQKGLEAVRLECEYLLGE